jgi:hypothetical protein
MKPKKLMITEKIGEIDFWCDLSGSFDQVIENLKVCKKAYHSKHSLQNGEEIYLDYTCNYDEGSLDVILKRYEYDKEYNNRLKKENRAKTSVKDRELKEYKRLKRKYG